MRTRRERERDLNNSDCRVLFVSATIQKHVRLCIMLFMAQTDLLDVRWLYWIHFLNLFLLKVGKITSVTCRACQLHGLAVEEPPLAKGLTPGAAQK